jgi:hypothetical protein
VDEEGNISEILVGLTIREFDCNYSMTYTRDDDTLHYKLMPPLDEFRLDRWIDRIDEASSGTGLHALYWTRVTQLLLELQRPEQRNNRLYQRTLRELKEQLQADIRNTLDPRTYPYTSNPDTRAKLHRILWGLQQGVSGEELIFLIMEQEL